MIKLTKKQKKWLIENGFIGQRTFDLASGWKDYLLNQFQWFIEEEPFKEYDSGTHLSYDLNHMEFIDKNDKDFSMKLDLFISKEKLQELLSIK